MIEKIALRIFWTAAFACAGILLMAIWTSPEPPEVLMKSAFTAFVVGFAAFIVWAPLLAYRFYKKF